MLRGGKSLCTDISSSGSFTDLTPFHLHVCKLLQRERKKGREILQLFLTRFSFEHDPCSLMYGTRQPSKNCVTKCVWVCVCVRTATCCTALHSLAVHAVTECTVCFRSTELAELSPETCVISTEVISCSWRAAWLSSCSLCEEASGLPHSTPQFQLLLYWTQLTRRMSS